MTIEFSLRAAGADAAAKYNDTWFAIDVFEPGDVKELGTVLHEYQGRMYQVWLNDHFQRTAKERRQHKGVTA